MSTEDPRRGPYGRGWYTDTQIAGIQRYYDGVAWTTRTRPVRATAPGEAPKKSHHAAQPNPRPIDHFGERIQHGKYGFRLTREMYAIPNWTPSIRQRRHLFTDRQWARMDSVFEDSDHTRYTDKVVEDMRISALRNFDLNMAFFAQISHEEFERALAAMLSENPSVEEVEDLWSLDGAQGVYVMVLDQYRQAYIGTAFNMRERIRQHWRGTKQFDRLVWGTEEESVMSIDSFRALDTNRIFAVETTDHFHVENALERGFLGDFLLNRIHGGEMTGIRARFIDSEVKRRRLNALNDPQSIEVT
ncbi:DUF2510 domain-containing protein [Microbacterium sp. SS28]|uniref:DUF2510 domain-containing protein n=1 Tax=Microbacterium sp. SS28 TaxID=2919948 RepID=UPI001FAA72FE|nr:DUF2510 domain-containing protein [Microbacterium sp. SS28]